MAQIAFKAVSAGSTERDAELKQFRDCSLLPGRKPEQKALFYFCSWLTRQSVYLSHWEELLFVSFLYGSKSMWCRCFWGSRVCCVNSVSHASGERLFSSKPHSPSSEATSKPLSGSLAMVGDSETLELTSHVQVALSETRKLLFQLSMWWSFNNKLGTT